MAIDLDPFRPARPAKPEPKRDGRGRYVVAEPDGSFKSHTRVTTIVKQLDDRYNLERWEQRLIVRGLILREDYFALVTSLDIDHDKKEMHRIFNLAKEFAKGSVGANTGVALHRLTDRIDMGARKIEDYPSKFHPILRCYVDGMDASGLTYDLDYVEQVIIDDVHHVAGTFDRAVIVTRDLHLTFKNGKRVFLPAGTRVIGDLKTGANLNFSWMSMAAQFAAYANHTATWDQVTSRRGPRIDFNTQAGLVIHLPASAEHPHLGLYWLDLETGFEAYKLGVQLHKVKAGGEKLATTHPVEDTQIVDAVAAWLRQRGEVILSIPAAKADLALHWPMILRNPDGSRKRLPDRPTPEEVAALVPVLDAIEAEYEIPFSPPMPGAEVIPITRGRRSGRRGT